MTTIYNIGQNYLKNFAISNHELQDKYKQYISKLTKEIQNNEIDIHLELENEHAKKITEIFDNAVFRFQEIYEEKAGETEDWIPYLVYNVKYTFE